MLEKGFLFDYQFTWWGSWDFVPVYMDILGYSRRLAEMFGYHLHSNPFHRMRLDNPRTDRNAISPECICRFRSTFTNAQKFD